MITLADLSNRITSYDLGPVIRANNFLIREDNVKCPYRYDLIRMQQLEENDKWKISNGSSVYSKSEKEFIHESLPSSRTNEVITDTRFDSVEEAVDAMNQYRITMTELYLSEGLTYWEGVV